MVDMAHFRATVAPGRRQTYRTRGPRPETERPADWTPRAAMAQYASDDA